MKTKYVVPFLMGISALVTTACTSDSLVEETYQGKKQITMTAPDFIVDGASRTSLNMGGNGGEFTWAENDTVGIFPNEGAQAYFPMTNGAGAKTASFNGGGWALKPSATYAAYFPYDFYNKTSKSIPVSFENQKQVGNASTAHLGNYDYMAAVAKTPESEIVNFQFEHLACLVEFTLALPIKGDMSSITFSSDEAIFTTKGTIDLTAATPQIMAAQKSKTLNLSIDNLTTTAENETVKVYMMMAPDKLKGKTVNVTVINNGVKHQGTTVLDDLVAGKAYRFTVALEKYYPLSNYYHVATPGTLSGLIGDANKYKVTELKLSGELNGTDIRFIRNMAGGSDYARTTPGQLTFLDLSEARIIEDNANNYYYNNYSTYYTKKDEISSYMFFNCSSLMEVILPNEVTSIDSYAFEKCTSLMSMVVTNSVTTIGNYAFSGCTNLTDVTIGNSVTTINSGAFSYCSSLASIDIPNSVVKLESGYYSSDSGVFEGCTSLNNVTLGNSLTTIGDAAFRNCTALIGITIPNSVTYIGSSAFLGCTALNGITIPNSVKTIGYEAFSGCKELSGVTLGSSVTSIGAGTFEDCTALTTIEIPNSVTDLGSSGGSSSGIFEGCTKLENITLGNSVTTIESRAFYGCTALASIIIPNSVTSVGIYAFSHCTALSSIVIPNSVTSVGIYAFSHCTALSSIVIPNSVTSIGNFTFADCSNLSDVTLGNSVTTIGRYAFNNCTALTSMAIPFSVTDTGDYAFENCTNLSEFKMQAPRKVLVQGAISEVGECKKLTLPHTLLQIKAGSLPYHVEAIYCFASQPPILYDKIPENCKIYVPQGSVSKYAAKDGWKNYAQNIAEIPQGITEE